MKKKRLLDSYALLAYLKEENGHGKVVDLLSSTSSDAPVLMNEINIGESYYIIARERGGEQADYFLETVLPSLPIKIVSNSFEDIIEASKIKAKYPISYADCFVVATALKEGATIITGDPEFEKVKSIVKVEWLKPI